jgi:uncharacterized protein (UPF0332 family)
MNPDLRGQRIDYRIAQAHESLKEADALFQASLYRGVINRSYYAMFYATLALAVLRSQVVSKHSGVIAFFDKEFIKTGVLPKQLSKALHIGFERRQFNDYGEVWLVDRDEAGNAITEAHNFVIEVEQYIQSGIEKSE